MHTDPTSAPRPAPEDPDRYDAVVIGGALSGAAFATLLRRWRPDARVLVVERRPAFDRKVGEATVELSAFFLHRVLGLYDPLSRHHLPKHGLRFWLADRADRKLEEMAELGPFRPPTLPSFQLDRARLDEDLLALAAAEGTEVARPARVCDVELGWPESRLTVATDGDRREVRARWVIDASGRSAFLARRLDLWQRTESHPTAAVWARWRGVADLDGPAVLGADPRRPSLPCVPASRRLATNHFCGYGWWCWVIPLANGETSIGVVWDKRLFELPGEGGLAARYEAFVRRWPGLGELTAGAEMEERDCRAYTHLAYCASRYAGDGWALVGDAASFIDPFYSPGLDHAAISIYATARLIEDDLAGRLDDAARGARLADHNQAFVGSYDRWLAALYRDKYEILGDAELTGAAFLFDTASYYLGVVTPVYRDVEALANPVFGQSIAGMTIAFRLIRAFNRRLVRLARWRRRVGLYGRRNANWRVVARSPGLGRAAFGMLRQGLGLWLRAELGYLARRWRHPFVDLSRPVPATHQAPADAAATAPAAGSAR